MNPPLQTCATRVMAVVGPTGVGKTELAERIASHVGGEIVSADSMQVYRGMDIGTAKPQQVARRVPYHCIDLVEPGEPFSAALFQDAARSAIAEIDSRGATPVLAGGTGLYVRAALDDWTFPAGEQQHNPIRGRYEECLRDHGSPALHALLSARDPDSAALIHPHNGRRIVRALEMLDHGESYARQHAGFADRQSIYDARFLGLSMDRARLYERIDVRVDAMIAAGLLGEVESLLRAGFRDALTAAQAIGYKELVPVIESDAPLDSAVESIKRATRRYAKRQLTWFRADSRIEWLDVTELSLADATTAAIELLESPNGPG